MLAFCQFFYFLSYTNHNTETVNFFFQESVNGGVWKYFSAVCWFYGKNLYDRFKRPVGLIATDWGGTPVESWSSPDALRKCNITGNKVDHV